MKYFITEYFKGEFGDKEINDSYENYIHSIFFQLPFPLKIITKAINFHDGLILELTLDKDKKCCSFLFLLGDLQIGYYFLHLNYKNFQIHDEVQFRKICAQKMEILADEVALSNHGVYTHNYIFTNFNELSISFTDVSINIEKTDEHSYMKSHKQEGVKIKE